MSNAPRKEFGWPAAVTLIAAMIGAAAASIAVAISPSVSPETNSRAAHVSSREIGEVKVRLEALESSTRQLRLELREDIKELRELVQASLNR